MTDLVRFIFVSYPADGRFYGIPAARRKVSADQLCRVSTSRNDWRTSDNPPADKLSIPVCQPAFKKCEPSHRAIGQCPHIETIAEIFGRSNVRIMLLLCHLYTFTRKYTVVIYFLLTSFSSSYFRFASIKPATFSGFSRAILCLFPNSRNSAERPFSVPTSKMPKIRAWGSFSVSFFTT